MGNETEKGTAPEVKEAPKHAVVNYLVQYECPYCEESLGDDEGGIDEGNEFYSKIEATTITCGSCKKEIKHDAIIVRTLPEGKS